LLHAISEGCRGLVRDSYEIQNAECFDVKARNHCALNGEICHSVFRRHASPFSSLDVRIIHSGNLLRLRRSAPVDPDMTATCYTSAQIQAFLIQLDIKEEQMSGKCSCPQKASRTLFSLSYVMFWRAPGPVMKDFKHFSSSELPRWRLASKGGL
jgi:hypothetical protein